MSWYFTKVDFTPSDENYYSTLAMKVFEWDISLMCRLYKIRGYEADDLAQELRLQLWRKLPLYDPTKSGLRTWAVKVMKNKIKDLYRYSKYNKREIQYHTIEHKEEIEDRAQD